MLIRAKRLRHLQYAHDGVAIGALGDARRIPAMRLHLWLALCLALAGCGSPSATSASSPTPAKVEAAIITEDTLAPEDIGAVVIGSAMTVAAFNEIQMAAVVFRDGVFSPADSYILGQLSNQDRRQTCRIVAFSSKGPLRPEATDTLIAVNGRMLRWAGNGGSSMYGHEGPPALTPGTPFVRIASLVYGGKAPGGYSSDVRNPENVAFAVHLFVRLVALTPKDARFAELHAVSHSSNISRELPIKALDEILGVDQTTKPQGATGF